MKVKRKGVSKEKHVKGGRKRSPLGVAIWKSQVSFAKAVVEEWQGKK